MNETQDKKKGQLVVALDVNTFEEAREIFHKLSDVVDVFKVGSQLFTSCGPVSVCYILAYGKKVFLDLKFHDIPNTVSNAVKAAVGMGEKVHEIVGTSDDDVKPDQGVFMCSVHTAGGKEMLTKSVMAAREEAERIGVERTLIVGITVLTSEKKTDNIKKIVLERALLAKEAGLDGVVASPQEASIIRRKLGDDFMIVTPGIRLVGYDSGDQKRIKTPSEAIAQGSNFLVVGRPIINSRDPLQAAKDILREMKKEQEKMEEKD